MGILPPNISTYGGDIDDLGVLITVLVGIGFIVAVAVFGYSLFRFNSKTGQKARYITGQSWGQLKWVILPTLIVLGMDFFIDAKTHSVWKLIKQTLPEADLNVRITGQQYSWIYTYPGKSGILGDPDGFQSTELHVPLGKNVVFDLESKDVLHSFWVPALRLKQDAVPGRTIKGWFNATKTGTYDIGCAQICGVGHTDMHSNLVVESPEEFSKWVGRKGASVAAEGAPGASLSSRGAQLVKSKGCFACHSSTGAPSVGPTYKGLFGKTETVLTGGQEREVRVDEAYLRKSIVDPKADIVKGFPPAMPELKGMLSEKDVDAIVEYIKTLK